MIFYKFIIFWRIPKSSKMNSDFPPTANAQPSKKAYSLYLWPGSKCWIRASRASIQHAATKVTNKDSFILRGRLFCLWQITYPCLCLGTVFFTGSFVVRNCTAIPSTHNASVSAALEFSEESVVIPIYSVTPGSSPAAEVPHTIAEVSIMTGRIYLTARTPTIRPVITFAKNCTSPSNGNNVPAALKANAKQRIKIPIR